MKLKNYTTIILLDKNTHKTKTYHIKSFYLENKNKIIYGFLGVIFILFGLISFLIYSNSSIQIEKYKMNKQISSLQNELKKLKDNKSIKKIQESEETLQNLEDFLQEKGVHVSKVIEENHENAIGGPYIPVENSNIDLNCKRIKYLVSTIKNIPLGYPHKGKITSRFGVRNNPFGSEQSEQHKGLDFKGEIGEPIHATAAGEIIHAGESNGYGNCIKIHHNSGFDTLYGHLSEINVRVGQIVKSGDVIGKLGNTGRSSGPHLHYEVRNGDNFFNPEFFLNLN